MDLYSEILVQKINRLQRDNDELRAALREIRDVTRVSEGVAFYEMLADKALSHE